MIDGLKLSMRGDTLQDRIATRIQFLERRIEWYREEIARASVADDGPALPEHICECEIARCEHSIEKLALIRRHLREEESCLPGCRDLTCAGPLPEPPV
jgi:hypothetical protein